MPGLLDTLGLLGSNNDQQPQQMTQEEMQHNLAIMNQLLSPKNKVLEPVGPEKYQATHWTQGAADILRTIAGKNIGHRVFDAQRAAGNAEIGAIPQPNIPGLNFSSAPGQGANTNIAPRRANADKGDNEPTRFVSRSGLPLAQITGPSGARFTVNEAYADRFKGLVDDLHKAGYKIHANQSGGYNPRNIRGTNKPSNHASGHAIDINWTANAQGTRGNIDPQLARALAKKHGLKWGGDFSKSDPMHFEIDRSASPQTTAAVPVQNRSITEFAGATPLGASNIETGSLPNEPGPDARTIVAQNFAENGPQPSRAGLPPEPRVAQAHQQQLQILHQQINDPRIPVERRLELSKQYMQLFAPAPQHFDQHVGDVTTRQTYYFDPRTGKNVPVPMGSTNQQTPDIARPQTSSGVPDNDDLLHEDILPLRIPPLPQSGDAGDLSNWQMQRRGIEELEKARRQQQIEMAGTRTQAYDTLKNLRVLATAERDNTIGGPLAQYELPLRQAITQLTGLEFSTVAPAELINKVATALGASAARLQFGNRTTQNEFSRFLETGIPNLAQTRAGRRMLIDLLMQDAQRQYDLANIAIRARSTEDYLNREHKYNKENPIYVRIGNKEIDTTAAKPGELTRFFEMNLGVGRRGSPQNQPGQRRNQSPGQQPRVYEYDPHNKTFR